VKGGANLADELGLAVGPGAVGEEDNRDGGVEIDPKGAAAEAEVSNGERGEVLTGRGVARRRVPPQRARAAGRALALREFRKSCRGEERRFAGRLRGRSGGKDLCGEAKQIGDVGEEAGVSCCTFKDVGVLVLHLALDDAMAEGGVLLSGRNVRASGRRGTEACGIEVEGLKDLIVDPGGEVFAHQHFKGFAEQDETGVGVLGALAGFSLKGQFEAGAEERGGCGVIAEELNVTGKAGVVREQVTEGDATRLRAGRATDDEGGKQFAKRQIEIEQSALVEEHGGGRGGDDLGEAGDVKDSIGSDGGRVVVVGEAPKRIVENDIPGREYREGTSGKGASGDGVAEHLMGGGELAGLGGQGGDRRS